MFVQIELGPCTFGPCRNSQATSPLSCWQNIHISLSGLIEASIICQWKVPNMRVSVIDLARNGFLFLKSARPEYASARLDPGVNAPRPVSYLKAIYIYICWYLKSSKLRISASSKLWWFCALNVNFSNPRERPVRNFQGFDCQIWTWWSSLSSALFTLQLGGGIKGEEIETCWMISLFNQLEYDFL